MDGEVNCRNDIPYWITCWAQYRSGHKNTPQILREIPCDKGLIRQRGPLEITFCGFASLELFMKLQLTWRRREEINGTKSTMRALWLSS